MPDPTEEQALNPHLRMVLTALVALRSTLDLTIVLVRSYVEVPESSPDPGGPVKQPPTFNQRRPT